MCRLCYVNYVGTNYRGNKIYEFIFTDNLEQVEGENWNITPANSNPHPPIDNIIDVGVINADLDLDLDLIQDSDTFGIRDAKHKIIPLCWENIMFIDEEDEDFYDRLFFMYGEKKEEVFDKLYSRGLDLKMQTV